MKPIFVILSAILTATVFSAAATGADEAIDSISATQKTLKEDQTSLKEALQAAIPFAEAGIRADRSCFDTPLDKVDINVIQEKIENIAPLIPYSEKIKAYIDTLANFGGIASTYNECCKFDTYPYNQEYVDSLQSVLINIYDIGNGILNPSQKESLNALYERINGYQPTVEAFDNLLKTVDEEVSLFRGNEQGDKLCAIEIKRVLTENENKAEIARIKEYRYLTHLFDSYEKELQASPRSMTPKIREELTMMLTQESKLEEKPESEPENGNETDDTHDQSTDLFD